MLTACGGAKKSAPQQAEGDAVAFKYATQISIEKFDGYTVATIKNPWKEGMTLHRYVLIPADQEVPNHIPSGTIVRTPLKRAVMFTTVHCAMLMEFGKQNCISGVADLKYIKIPWIQEQVAKGKISDVGDGMSPGKFEKDDWLKCTVTATLADGTTKDVEIYLAKDGDYVKDWQFCDFQSLENVTSLSFAFDSTKKNDYGVTTPTYMCIDDIEFEY